MEKKELPFVIGVLADLSGMPDKPLPMMKDRKFVPIDRDTFNKVLAKTEPRLALRVQNRLTDEDTKLSAELRFKHIDDFEPARVAEQIPALKELLDARQNLEQLLGKMMNSAQLEQLLEDIVSNPEKQAAVAQLIGVAADAPKTPDTKPEETK
jgi:type VI secretion system protein ImpB